MSFRSVHPNIAGTTAETLDEATAVFIALTAFNTVLRFTGFRNGIASFSADGLGGGNLTLDMTFGTANAEEALDLEFEPTVCLWHDVIAKASSIVLWEPGHSQNAPIINFINRSF